MKEVMPLIISETLRATYNIHSILYSIPTTIHQKYSKNKHLNLKNQCFCVLILPILQKIFDPATCWLHFSDKETAWKYWKTFLSIKWNHLLSMNLLDPSNQDLIATLGMTIKSWHCRAIPYTALLSRYKHFITSEGCSNWAF